MKIRNKVFGHNIVGRHWLRDAMHCVSTTPLMQYSISLIRLGEGGANNSDSFGTVVCAPPFITIPFTEGVALG